MNVDRIVVPDGRFRPVGDLTPLANSLTIFGQIQPIVVEEKTDILIAGYRRLSAAKLLGWTEIDTVYKGDLSKRQRREMELEENIQRKQMGMLEIEWAKVEIHRLRLEEDPNWTQRSTAAMLGVVPAVISQALLITRAAELFPEVAAAKTQRHALAIARYKLSLVKRAADVRDDKEAYAGVSDRIWLGDALKLIKLVQDESVSIVLTDPPFGIGYDIDRRVISTKASLYEDSRESYVRLLEIAPDLYRVIKPDGWLLWFLGPSWLAKCILVFEEVGFIVDPVPVIWDRSDGTCFTKKPEVYFGKAYDMALHAHKGSPQMVKRNKPNVIRVPPVSNRDRELMVERPIELYRELLERMTTPNESVLDPFTGSGAVLAAAAQRKQPYVGFELCEERRAVAVQKVTAHTPIG